MRRDDPLESSEYVSDGDTCVSYHYQMGLGPQTPNDTMPRFVNNTNATHSGAACPHLSGCFSDAHFLTRGFCNDSREESTTHLIMFRRDVLSLSRLVKAPEQVRGVLRDLFSNKGQMFSAS